MVGVTNSDVFPFFFWGGGGKSFQANVFVSIRIQFLNEMMKYAEAFFRPPKFVVFSAAKKCGWELRIK